MKTKPQISVIIPVKNGEDTLDACLNGIFNQTLADKLEIILIDSGSTDSSMEIARSFPVRIHEIAAKEFDHGETRNLGVKLAQGEFVVMTVQDAKPANEYWLETMLQHFKDTEVGGVCGQQIVAHDKDKNPLQWFRPASKAQANEIQFKNTAFTKLSGKKQRELCNWDDVTAMYRKTLIEKIPFRKTMFMEDTTWAKDALMAGVKIVYDYNARVYHYHHQNFKYYFRKTLLFYNLNLKEFEFYKLPENIFNSVLKILYRVNKEDVSIKEKIIWANYNLAIFRAKWYAAIKYYAAYKINGNKGIERLLANHVSKPPQGIQNKLATKK